MKKRIIFMFLFMIVIIPFNVSAASIKDTTISGATSKKIGEEVNVSVAISFDGIEKGNSSSLGIWVVGYELIFDDSVFVVSEISSNSNEWISNLYKSDGKYYVLSEISEGNPFSNKCVDGYLQCADYIVDIKFYIKSTDVTSSTITVGEVEALLFPATEQEEYNVDDAILISTISNKNHIVQIQKAETNTIKETTTPKETMTIKEESKPIEKKENSNENAKSSNRYLSSLEIENYEIDFSKEKNIMK